MGRTARTIPQGKYILRLPKVVDEHQAYPIYLYYYCNGNKIRESTSICTKAADWDSKSGVLRASFGTDYKKHNNYLQKLIRKVDNSIFDYIEKNGHITPTIIKNLISGDNTPLREDRGISFLNYAREVLKKKYDYRKIRVSTYKNGLTNINQFEKFMKSRESTDADIFIGDITEEMVRNFLSWELERGRKKDTVEKYLETICKVCTSASEHGLLSKTVSQSIADIELEYGIGDEAHKTIKYLTCEEMGRLVHLDRNTLTKRQKDFIDMFLFSFYSCGLRVSDIITLRWCDINFEKKEIDKTQVKTRGRNFVPLTDEGLKILESWQCKNRIFVFGLLPDNFDLDDEEELRIRRNSVTSTINRSLKRLSEIVQLDKKVTFHMSRHTWAVLALEKGVEISKISRLLGHTSSAVTEKVYCRFLPETLGDVVDELDFKF